MTSSYPVEYYIFQRDDLYGKTLQRKHYVICQPVCTLQITHEVVYLDDGRNYITTAKPRKFESFDLLLSTYNAIVQSLVMRDYEEMPILSEYRKPIDFDKVLAEEEELICDVDDPLFLDLGDEDE
jgi:hypothetical protein